jgi:pyridoxal phosphate enzyme, YggS family
MTDGSLNENSAAKLCGSIKLIRNEITALAPGRQVTLLGATKTVPPEIINLAVREGGLTDIGENRVQELLEKYPSLDRERIKIHFIGRLQLNKVKSLIGKVSLIHSVDSTALAREIDRRSGAAGLRTDILVEINSGEESEKGGINPAQTDEFLAELAEFHNIKVRGFMAVAPVCADPEDYMPYFTLTKSLFDRYFSGTDGILSMGMSDSYRQALRCGSNLVRIGSAIFGKR